jgi:hypothetical protein
MRRTAVLTTLSHNSSSVIVCPKQQCTARSPRFILGVLRAGLFLNMGYCISVPVLVAMPSTGVTVRGPGVPPNLGFACCDQGVEEMQALFNHQVVIADLKDLHAEVAIPILDFSPERAATVHRLNEAGIPVIAGLLVPKEGYYFTADNEPAAAVRFAAFDAWSRNHGLRWNGVGLDIEPNFAELGTLRSHPWRLFTTLLWRAVDVQRMRRAKRAYSALIADMRAQGYFVQTYQLPILPVERRAHSSLLDRLLGTVDVRGDQEVLMLYTSYAPPPVGAAIIWKLGPDAQAIAIGVTDGDPRAYPAVLDWSRFSRDLIVAGHFTHLIGVYDLEGCVRQGLLSRLKTMNWNQSVTIPADAIRRADHRLLLLRLILWISSHFLYLVVVLAVIIALIAWRWRIHKMKRKLSTQTTVLSSQPTRPGETHYSRWQCLGPRCHAAIACSYRLRTALWSHACQRDLYPDS